MENFSYHSNESTRETSTRNATFVEANVMNILQSFSFIPLTASKEMIFENLFAKLAFLLPWQQSNSVVWTKFIYLVEDYSRNTSVKL